MQANERQREAAMMRMDGYTYDEIGEKLGVSKQRAYQLARAAIDGEGHKTGGRRGRHCIYPQIQEYLEANGMSYAELSRQSGISSVAIIRFLCDGRKGIRLATAMQLASAMNMTVEEAFARD